jgi:hypothetical protein
MRKPFVKVNIEDLIYAKEFFENASDYMLWLYAVTEYYQGNEVTIKKKIVKKYFDNYKKTMNIVIGAKESGKKGFEKRIENQQVNVETLEGYHEGMHEDTHRVNNKIVNNKDKEVNNPPNPPKGGSDEIQKFCSWFNNQLFIHTGNVGKFKTMTKTDISNLKRLKQGYTIDEWEHAFKMMIQSEWVQESKMATVAHFLRNDNFTKYVNQKTEQPKFRAAWD